MRVLVIGAGQLARMMAPPAVGLNIKLHLLAEAPDASAAQVIRNVVVGDPSNEDAVLAALETNPDVVTFEHEQIPPNTLELLESRLSVRPAANALLYAQDKLEMRRRLSELGLPVPKFAVIASPQDLQRFLADNGGRAVLKTTRGGYDGKGVAVVSDPSEAADWFDGRGLIAEQFVPFDYEVAALVARRPSGSTVVIGHELPGECRSWPLTLTTQENGVCYSAVAPAPVPQVVQERAQQIAQTIACELDVTGVLAVEMFVVGDQLMINELAMRPHNSGHWTIDGSSISQFEQHLRAVLDLPLATPNMLAPTAVMVNVLGSQLDDFEEAKRRVLEHNPDARVHLYGKEVRPGRKLGHVTVCGDDWHLALEQAESAAATLRGTK